MSEFIVKTTQTWKPLHEELPEIGKSVEVLCTMTTKASLISADPQLWQQDGTMDDAHTEVKLWREIEPTT
jgi:hypothetical protein